MVESENGALEHLGLLGNLPVVKSSSRCGEDEGPDNDAALCSRASHKIIISHPRTQKSHNLIQIN